MTKMDCWLSVYETQLAAGTFVDYIQNHKDSPKILISNALSEVWRCGRVYQKSLESQKVKKIKKHKEKKHRS